MTSLQRSESSRATGGLDLSASSSAGNGSIWSQLKNTAVSVGSVVGRVGPSVLLQPKVRLRDRFADRLFFHRSPPRLGNLPPDHLFFQGWAWMSLQFILKA